MSGPVHDSRRALPIGLYGLGGSNKASTIPMSSKRRGGVDQSSTPPLGFVSGT